MATPDVFKRPGLIQLDRICVKMLHTDRGLVSRQQKYFRVSVPHAFAGCELVQWLHEQLHLDDTGYACQFFRVLMRDEPSAEAVHLATLLVQHGYLFPVIERSNIVRDDHTLYRFQIPYFWPSHIGHIDDVEYGSLTNVPQCTHWHCSAIYLSKRLMRNEERHGLEAYEVEAYNKLMELVGHMWDFITVQAEMQLKLHKERKKIDKVILDSQELTLWHLQRPHSSQTGCLEQHQCKLDKKMKKKTLRMYEKEVVRFKFALKTKPWLKSPKSSETTVSYCEQLHDYDPFISACQPSNPWISDDLSLWAFNTDTVEVPTERRVRRWGLRVQELVRDPIGRQVLETFLESEFSSENLRFWSAIQDLKGSPQSVVSAKVAHIFEEYLTAGASCQVNVDSRTLEGATKAMANNNLPRRHALSQAEENVFTLMSKDSYPRFIRSEIYKGVLKAAQQQGSKRLGWKNFIFNMGQGRKNYTLSATAASSGISKKPVQREDNSHCSLLTIPSDDSLAICSTMAMTVVREAEWEGNE